MKRYRIRLYELSEHKSSNHKNVVCVIYDDSVETGQNQTTHEGAEIARGLWDTWIHIPFEFLLFHYWKLHHLNINEVFLSGFYFDFQMRVFDGGTTGRDNVSTLTFLAKLSRFWFDFFSSFVGAIFLKSRYPLFSICSPAFSRCGFLVFWKWTFTLEI